MIASAYPDYSSDPSKERLEWFMAQQALLAGFVKFLARDGSITIRHDLEKIEDDWLEEVTEEYLIG